MQRFKLILVPFSLIYWLISFIRNGLYNTGIFSQTRFSIPIISIGNITVGGTGKTPHTEYVISQLMSKYSIAALSRGYKRKSKGYKDSVSNSDVDMLGDESYMLHTKFPHILVAVCENRVKGIETIVQKFPHISLIILDDAFQHRAVLPDFQIVLVDYSRPLWKDFVFPAGFLREGTYAIQRADSVIITKAESLNEEQKEWWRKKLRLGSHQSLFVSHFTYGLPYHAFLAQQTSIHDITNKHGVLLVSGLAQSNALYDYIAQFSSDIVHLDYSDHCTYTKDHVLDIEAVYASMSKSRPVFIITTQKDEHKLKKAGISHELPVYVIPIEPQFYGADSEQLLAQIRTSISEKNPQ